VLPPGLQSLVQAAEKPAPSGTAARLELVSSPLEAEIRASLLRTAAEQVGSIQHREWVRVRDRIGFCCKGQGYSSCHDSKVQNAGHAHSLSFMTLDTYGCCVS